MEPPIIAPAAVAFSWIGPYAGISFGVTRTKDKRPVYGMREERTEHPGEYRPFTKRDLWKDVRKNGCEGKPKNYTMTFGGPENNDHSYGFTCKGLAGLGPNYEGGGNIYVQGLDPVTVKEPYSEFTGSERFLAGTETVTEDHATYGAFGGYRWQDASGFVLGGEVAGNYYDDDFGFTAKGQAGWAFGRALPYLSAGYDFREESATVGVGMDYALTDRWFIGASYDYLLDTEGQAVAARVGIKF